MTPNYAEGVREPNVAGFARIQASVAVRLYFYEVTTNNAGYFAEPFARVQRSLVLERREC